MGTQIETKQQHTERTNHRDYILTSDPAGEMKYRAKCQECDDVLDIGGPRYTRSEAKP